MSKKDDFKNTSIFDDVCKFWMSINSMLGIIRKRDDLVEIFRKQTFDIKDLIKQFSAFLIEIIQGTFRMNFKRFDNKIIGTSEIQKFVTSFVKLGRELGKNPTVDFSILHFMKFLLNYYNEKNSDKNFWNVFTSMTPKITNKWLIHFYKKLYFKFVKNQSETESIPLGSDISLLSLYQLNEDIYKNDYFEVCSLIYSFLLKMREGDDDREEEFLNFLNDLRHAEKSKKKTKQNKIISKETSFRAEISNFLSKTHKTVEIKTSFSYCNKEDLYKHYDKLREIISEDILQGFTNELGEIYDDSEKESDIIVNVLNPYSLFTRKSDMIKLKDNAPYEKFYERWNYILEMKEQLEFSLILRSHLLNNSEVMFELNQRQNDSILKTSAILSLLTNIFYIYPSKNILILNIGPICFLIHLYYLFFSILINLYNTILCLKIQGEKYKGNLLYDTLNYLKEEEIIPILLNFILCLLAIYFSNIQNLFFSLQLFSVFLIFPVMTNVIASVNQKYREFIYTTVLIIILTLFYSSISFYYFRNDYFNDDLNVSFLVNLGKRM